MRNFDVILSPVLVYVTPELGFLNPQVPFDELFERMMNYVSFTPINNASGSPAISLPVGMSEKGLPIAVQFSSAHGDERTLLELALDRKSTRLNSSHVRISYAVFCLKKKKKQ